MVSGATGFCAWDPAVSLLAPGSDAMAEPLVPFWATSAAAGMAGNFIGRLQVALPDRWPETHRALAVDSAQWPQPIRKSPRTAVGGRPVPEAGGPETCLRGALGSVFR